MTSLRFRVLRLMFQQRGMFLRLSLAFVLCLGAFFPASAATVPGNRCKDRCNDVYRLKKDLCRSIPLKGERKACEKSAKRTRDNCKHRCR
jgi:hypothetical protein